MASQGSITPRRASSSGSAPADDYVETIIIASDEDPVASDCDDANASDNNERSEPPVGRTEPSSATADPAPSTASIFMSSFWPWAKGHTGPSAPLVPGQLFSPGRQSLDPWLFFAALAISCFGLVMVYSSSAWVSASVANTWEYYLKRQALFMLIGLGAMFVAIRIDYRVLRRFAPHLMVIGLGLLIAVLFVSRKINGANRWLSIGSLGIQPSEFAKVALAIFLAATLARQGERVRSFSRGFAPPMFAAGLTILLVLLGRDLGTAFLLGSLTLVMLFVAGTRLSFVFGAVLLAAPLVWSRIVNVGYRTERLLEFLANEDFQVQQSLIAIGSGGAWGRGLGLSRQKLGFLPECQTDFILAVIGEELGVVGIAAVIGLYGLIVWRGIAAARDAPDRFGAYLATGLTAMIGLQALINMAVVLKVIPAKGITLPFVSAGGSSLIVSLACIGILLGISRRPIPCRWADQRSAPPPRKQTQARDRGHKTTSRLSALVGRGQPAKPARQRRVNTKNKAREGGHARR